MRDLRKSQSYPIDDEDSARITALSISSKSFMTKIGSVVDTELINHEVDRCIIRCAQEAFKNSKTVDPDGVKLMIGRWVLTLKREAPPLEDIKKRFEHCKSLNVDEEAFTPVVVEIVKEGALQSARIAAALGTHLSAPKLAQMFRGVEVIGSAQEEVEEAFTPEHQDFTLEEPHLISTGCVVLDNLMLGGFEPNSLWMLQGEQGAGKSFALTTLSAEMVYQGKYVLSVTLELMGKLWMQRVMSNLLQLSGRDATQERMRKAYERWCEKYGDHGSIWVRRMENGTTPAELREVILKKIDEAKIDNPEEDLIVMVDYLDLMSPNPEDRTKQGMYLDMKHVYEQVRSFCQPEHGGAICRNVWTVSQVQRLSGKQAKEGNHGINNASDSQWKSRTVDGQIAMRMSELEKEDGIRRYKILKRRNWEGSSDEEEVDTAFEVGGLWPTPHRSL